MAIILVAILVIAVALLIFVIAKSSVASHHVEGLERMLEQGKYNTAIKTAKRILTKDPNNYMAHYYLGKAYIASGRGELALAEYQEVNNTAIFGDGLDELAFRKEMAPMYLKYNRNGDALREYLLLTKLEPENAGNFFNAAKLYEAQGREDLALNYFKKTVLLDKKHAKAYAAIGLILYHLKQFNEAKKSIDHALKLEPDTYSSYYYLGKILKDNKDYAGALKAFEKAQRDAEYKQKALIEHGTCYMLGGRPDNGIGDLTRAIEVDKAGDRQETLYARYFLAACYEQVRKIEKAIEQWTIISKKNKSFRDVAAKLEEYRDLATNDALKDYLTASPDEFQEICKAAAGALNMAAQSVTANKSGCRVVATERKGEEWRNTRKQLFLLSFYRDTAPIEEHVVRDELDKMKDAKCMKVYVLSSSDFSNTAALFAENRPVELIGKDKLESILTKASS